MPREDEHTTKAQRNESFAASLNFTDATQEMWAVTAVFYSALHYVQAYFVRGGAGDDCKKHAVRFTEIKRDRKLRAISVQYEYLYSLSLLSRYYLKGLPDRPYEVAKANLEAVKKQVAHAMSN